MYTYAFGTPTYKYIWLNAESTGNLTWGGYERVVLRGGSLGGQNMQNGGPSRDELSQEEPSQPRPSHAELSQIEAKLSQAVEPSGAMPR